MIHLISTWSREYQSLADLTWNQNKVPYAVKNGYQFHCCVHEDPTKIVWDRLAFLRTQMEQSPENDWFLFSGADAFISRPDYQIESFIPENADFVCGLDFRVIFGDWLLLRNCSATRKLITDVISSITWTFANEQVAFSCLLAKSKSHREYLNLASGWCNTPEFYEKIEGFYNANEYGIRVKIRSPFQSPKFAGDIAWIHDGNENIVPKFLEWDKDTFILHMGGKPLHFRLGLIPLLMPKFDLLALENARITTAMIHHFTSLL